MPSATLSKFLREYTAGTALILSFRCRRALLPTICRDSPAKVGGSKINPQAPAKPAPQRSQSKRVASLEADQQRQVGKVFYADGNVTFSSKTRLRADHVEYNRKTKSSSPAVT